NNFLNCTVKVGPNSLITYLSDNETGAVGDDVSGCGAIAFDPSNDGTGRMVLFIQGAYLRDSDEFLPGETEGAANPNFGKVIEKYQFNDGAVVVAGHYVTSFDAAAISGCVLPSEGESSVPGYDFSKPAGIQAIMRVIDDKHYNSLSDEDRASYNPSPSDRRGLLIVNDVQTHGKLASDTYWDLYTPSALGYQGNSWAYSNSDQNTFFNVRRGFVLGVNGKMDVYHNTFVDHASGSTNQVDPLAYYDFADPTLDGTPSLIKKRNPSAFIVDGLDPALFVSGNPFILDEGGSPSLSLFSVANPFAQTPAQPAEPARANIHFRGNGAMYFKSAASTFHGNMFTFWANNGASPDWATVDWTSSLVVTDNSTYDGFLLSVDDEGHVKTSGEGEHVFDAEGPLLVDRENAAAQDRTYASSGDMATIGAIALPIDHRGAELQQDLVTTLNRPLLLGTSYARYNSPTLFFNNNVTFNSVIFRHSEPTHYVDGLPNVSEPGMTGGERMWFGIKFWDASGLSDATVNRASDPNRYRFPEVQLHNAALALEESLNASGLRFVVKDAFKPVDADTGAGTATASSTATNESAVIFYDHGDPLDTLLTGFGRIFLNGSSLNLMADDTNNFVTESCCWNVFKHNKPVSATPSDSSSVRLLLGSANQFHPDIKAFMDGLGTQAAKDRFADKQRAHHLFMFAQPPAVTNLDLTVDGEDPVCNLAVGWPSVQTLDGTIAGTGAPAADGGNFPFVLPYAGREPLVSDMASNFPDYAAALWVPNALTSPAARLSIEGSIICFGSFDKDGNSLPVPVATDNDSGVVYVKHGGKIDTSYKALSGGSDSRYKLPYQSVFSTMLAQRIWNDYNYDGNQRLCFLSGCIDLPSDQVKFDPNYAVQPYNFTQEMFAARRNQVVEDVEGTDTQGYVRVSGYNASNALGDRAGIEEMLIGWTYRDTPDYSATHVSDVEGQPDFNNMPTKKAPKDKIMAARKSVSPQAMKAASKWTARSTESIDQLQARPLDLLYIGPGDDIKQLRVAGATMSDPFMLDVTGDGVRPLVARVREFTSEKTTRDQLADRFVGEGAHAVLFVEYGGNIGLGSQNWNEQSDSAWNLLGKDNISIAPLGDGVVTVNSNLIVVDRLALLPTAEFGNAGVQRLTFTSVQPREIRIPAGGELDLSGFGKATNRQEIAFGGNITLVFEAGSTLRLPDNPTGAGMVVYLTDQAKMIFEGNSNTSNYVPFSDLTSSSNTAPAADYRTRIVGQGQIWLNKNATIGVYGNSFVGVESDSDNLVTDVTISLQRQSRFEIGSDTLAGGAFQVGNPTDRGDGHSVSFNLTVNGPNATFHIDREGFFGLGAGVVNKSGKPNGTASSGNNPVVDGDGAAVLDPDGFPTFNPMSIVASPSSDGDYSANYAALSSGVWVLQALRNVAAVTVQLQNGIFEHKNIADGSTSQSSLIAVGPSAGFTWKQAPSTVFNVRGGGNLVLIPATSGAFYAANIWDFAGAVATGENYGILASGQSLLDRAVADDIADATAFGDGGSTFSFTSASDFFNFINTRAYDLQGTSRARRVNLSQTLFATQIDYITQSGSKYSVGGEIVRAAAPAASTAGGTLAEAAAVGSLQALGTPQPETFSVVK
ncbi:hypothetical protein EBZ39_08185, partial [bacterium]|nr:hypothetical protein [bacterium]